LLGHFLAFFIAASQLRMDSILSATESAMSRAAWLDAGAGGGGDNDTAEVAGSRPGGGGGGGFGLPLQVPRVTPTQVALLPPRPGDPELLAAVMAPLTWEASKTYTLLEWARYGMTRYALEVGLRILV
jgi:hypothetical protein